MVPGDLCELGVNTVLGENTSGPVGEEDIDDSVVRRMDEQHRRSAGDPVRGNGQESGDGDDGRDRRYGRRP